MIEEPYRWVEAIANRREYIEAHFDEDPSLARLASLSGLTQTRIA